MEAAGRDALTATLTRGAKDLGVPLSDSQVEMCVTYATRLIEYNTHTNLTRITDPAEMAIKHFVDSLTVFVACPVIAEGAVVADVGTGAGFPGLVLKIVRPDLRLTLIDSLAKRLTFLGGIVEALGLKNVALLHARAEDAGRQPGHRDMYDLVTARAVAALPTLLEWCGPLVRIGGQFVAMKSSGIDAELIDAAGATQKLGLQLTQDLPISLPTGSDETENAAPSRRLLVYKKLRRTPEIYPRGAAQIKSRPLL